MCRFGITPESIFSDPVLTPAAKVLYGVLRMFGNAETGLCCPSIDQLAEASCLSHASVERSLKALRESGWVVAEVLITAKAKRSKYTFPRDEQLSLKMRESAGGVSHKMRETTPPLSLKMRESDPQNEGESHYKVGTDNRTDAVLTSYQANPKEPAPSAGENSARGNGAPSTAKPLTTPALLNVDAILTATDADLLPRRTDLDLDAIFQTFLRLQKKFRRTRHLPALAQRAIYILGHSPDIVPALTQAEIERIVTNWLEANIPAKVQGLFLPSVKFPDELGWEVCLRFGTWNAEKPAPDSGSVLDLVKTGVEQGAMP
jgi:hypothetical protein